MELLGRVLAPAAARVGAQGRFGTLGLDQVAVGPAAVVVAVAGPVEGILEGFRAPRAEVWHRRDLEVAV